MLKEVVKYPLDIRGVESTEFNEVKSPFNGEVVAAIGQADEKAIDTALTVAEDVFKNVMRQMPAHQRSEILHKTSKLLLEKKEDIARTIALEGGKPIKDARIEVSRAANTFLLASHEAMRLDGEQIPMDVTAGNENRHGSA
jgi:acyl-CoA reductase-like NAD-dependent aldehyde dehydrogenase